MFVYIHKHLHIDNIYNTSVGNKQYMDIYIYTDVIDFYMCSTYLLYWVAFVLIFRCRMQLYVFDFFMPPTFYLFWEDLC